MKVRAQASCQATSFAQRLIKNARPSVAAARFALALAALLVGDIIATPAASAAGAPPAPASDLARVKERGRLVMLCFPSQDNPMVAANLDVMREQHLKLTQLHRPDQFAGIEIDILNGFAKSLGVELEIHAVTKGYDALMPALVQHQGDVAASSLTITAKRQKVADFSTSTYTAWVLVLVRRDSQLTSLADLAGRRAAVMRGSSQEEFLREAVPTAKILPTTFSAENLLALADGKVDFTLMDANNPEGEGLGNTPTGDFQNLKVGFPLRKVENGIAVRKGSDLLAPLNAYLAAIEKSGELQRIFERHGLPRPTG